MKVCKGCKVEKGAGCFYAARGTRDGLHGKCKDCMKARQKEMKAIERAGPRVPAQRREEKEWSCRAVLGREAISIQISGPLTAAQAERVRRIIEANTEVGPPEPLPCRSLPRPADGQSGEPKEAL